MAKGTLFIIGLGLHDEEGITLRGLKAAREADKVFLEHYTSLMPALSLNRLEELLGKPIRTVDRTVLEDLDAEPILSEALKGKKVALLVPGDPMIATTHVAVRLRAEELGIRTKVIHAPSIMTAVIGLTGLQSYRFGRSVTITYPEHGLVSEAPYWTVLENKVRDLHTLCLLDARADEGRYMTIKEALKIMIELEERLGKGLIEPNTLAIGIARAGSPEPIVKADGIEALLNYDFGPPPHTLVFPAQLHFLEAKALKLLADAPDWVFRRGAGGRGR